METKDINISIKAINKFFYYSMNYPCIRFEYDTYAGTTKSEYLPDFFKAFPYHLLQHFADKWRGITRDARGDSYGFINKFYAELDSTYRAEMLKYIMENYNDECFIHTFEEE